MLKKWYQATPEQDATRELARVLAEPIPPLYSAHWLAEIHGGLIAHSRLVKEPNFRKIHIDDLHWLFERYDSLFFQGGLLGALKSRPLRFRLSPRMSKVGGMTSSILNRGGERSFEIAIASSILFDGFKDDHRTVTACGLECRDRLEALQRIFEHELVHLAEFLAWGASNCKGARFREITRGFFGHRAHTHALITRRERAAASGIGVGSRVTFVFEGRRFEGRVNRVTKRATVLVEDSRGRLFSDGVRYNTYYVPLNWLQPAAALAATGTR